MAKRSSLGPSLLAVAALSCSFYVACGDDDIIIGAGGDNGGTGGTASGAGGGGSGAGGSAGLGGGAGTGVLPVDGGTDAEVGDTGVPDAADTGADVGTTSNG